MKALYKYRVLIAVGILALVYIFLDHLLRWVM